MNKAQTGLLALIALEPGARLLGLLLKVIVLPLVVLAVLVGSAVTGNSGWLVTPLLLILGVWFLAVRGGRRRPQ
jgi:hypothetical protein